MKWVVFLISCALQTWAIQGGLPIPKDWQVRSPVVRLGSGERGNPVSKCSGILLSSKVILTAAHCFREFNSIRKISVENLETGQIHSSTFKKIAKAGYPADFHEHPDFKKNGYDIGIIVLRWEVPFKLPTFELAKEERNLNLLVPNVWLIANGSQAPMYDSSSASIPIANVVRYSFEGKDSFYRYQSAHAKSGPCEGDSGGGIFSWNDGVWTLEGIQSTKLSAPDCGDDLNRGYFVPIFSNREWILSVLKGI